MQSNECEGGGIVRIVVVESRYRAESEWELQRNLAYARALVAHVTLRGDSPVASHLTITQALDDLDPAQRNAGIEAGLALLRVADVHLFGVDLGISDGMANAMNIAKESLENWGRPMYEELSLPEWAAAAEADAKSGMILRTAGLVHRWQPKWHPHPAR